MPQSHQWSHLNKLQIGRYGEYFFKMKFVLHGFDVYSPEVDDRGIDFVLRWEPNRYWDVQVKSVRDTGYVFFHKSKFRLRPSLLVALAVFEQGHEPNLFLIPSMKWKNPDGVLVDRDYAGEGQISPPEYGINVSKKGLKALEQFRFTDALVETIFGTDENKHSF